jgi:hypothetical protein
MSDTLKIGQADARKNRVRMPQDVSSRNFAASTDRETFRADEEGVDADVPVDAKNASTSDFENCRQFSTAPTPNLFFFKEERRRTKKEEQMTQIA